MPKLTYANVVSTIALFLAIGGGATAIALSLPKNSVKSKQLAKEAVKNSDIAKDGVTGDKVKESTLGKVPLAAHADSADTAGSASSAGHASTAETAASATALSGFAPNNLAKTYSTSSAFFTSQLNLEVPGYGTYFVKCFTNTGDNNDDEVEFGYNSNPGPGAIETVYGSSSSEPAEAPLNRIFAGNEAGGFGTFGLNNDRMFFSYRVAIPGTTRAALIEAAAFDNSSNSGCAGQIQAFVIS
ncbi:MAG TPA: hypothetical protein VF125_02080 [Solirubrobacterales bacterium]